MTLSVIPRYDICTGGKPDTAAMGPRNLATRNASLVLNLDGIDVDRLQECRTGLPPVRTQLRAADREDAFAKPVQTQQPAGTWPEPRSRAARTTKQGESSHNTRSYLLILCLGMTVTSELWCLA